MNTQHRGQLKLLCRRAAQGKKQDIDHIMAKLKQEPSLVMTKFIDYALGLVVTKEGCQRIEYYLFKGSKIQRNYACLFFNRLGEWKVVKKAFEQVLIDEIQAFSR